ncbi:hypothetical protein ACS0TY_027506 [Phlomoides rotata]
MADIIPKQIEHMSELVELCDIDCFDNLRMNRNTFNRLCYLLRHSGGLVDGRYVTVGEQVPCSFVYYRITRNVVLKPSTVISTTSYGLSFNCTTSSLLSQHRWTMIALILAGNISRDTLASEMYNNWRGNMFTCNTGLMEGVTTDQVMEKLRNRNDKGRRGWSIREEQVLSEAMKKIVREGWKSENGFKYGYLNLLGTYMKQVLPTTDLKPEPHINSRITVWKKNYHNLFEILKNTGFGLDSTTKMVEATEEQWAAFMKKDYNVRLMKHKSWSLYEDWCEIFGQSRATDEGAESHANADTPPPSYKAAFEADYGFDKVVDEKQGESQTPSGYAVTGESSDMAKTGSGRKQKTPSILNLMVNVVQNFCEHASTRLGDIAQRIGHEQDISAVRKMIYSSVTQMNMLTLQEKLRATALIARNTEDIDVFFSLPFLMGISNGWK